MCLLICIFAGRNEQINSIMKKINLFLTSVLLLVAGLQTASAQYGMQVWEKGQLTLFRVGETDSVRFVKLVTGIQLSQNAIEMVVGETYQLTATILPENADVKTLVWHSNSAGVSVDETGLVTANFKGDYTVTCSTTDGTNVSVACIVTVTEPVEPYEYVDLGLPSGTLWATFNVGAENPEDYGDYFAWGETQAKEDYSWDTYQLCNASYDALTKYCSQSDYGFEGFTDELTTLLPEDDAATSIWGSKWQMPTSAQQTELLSGEYTNNVWTTQNGVNGWKITSKSNGNSIFLPAAGSRNGTNVSQAGSQGLYWSHSIYPEESCEAWYFQFSSSNSSWDFDYRNIGMSIRPVRKDHEYVDLGLPSGTLWATCNVGANRPEEYGDYFAWGETEPKEEYTWGTYNDVTVTENELLPEDDAATANWGEDWQMPNMTQMEELYNSDYTTTEWTTQNGVDGYKITSNSNGNSIFLPATGYRDGTNLKNAGISGDYWTRSYYSRSFSYGMIFRLDEIGCYFNYPHNGLTVRAVKKKQTVQE